MGSWDPRALVRSVWHRDPRAFVRAHAMPVVAVLAALVTCVAVPPDAVYAGYVHVDTLERIAAMLAVVGAMRSEGMIERLAAHVVARLRSPRVLVGVLTALTGVASMFVTNDMALLALLPLAAAALLAAGRPDMIAPTFVLQGLAANLCGMVLPFGNPQNIFLTSAYGIGLVDFVRMTLPPFIVSCVLLVLATVCLTRVGRSGGRQRVGDDGARPDDRAQIAALAAAPDRPTPAAPASRHAPSPARVAILTGLLVLCVLSVLGLVDAGLTLVVVLGVRVALDRGLRGLVRTDWGLVVTFAAFFVLSGNLARVDAVRDLLASWLVGGAFVPGVLASQVISNVPAAVTLQRFTGDWAGLLAGVNVGGAGTPVGSLATLIVIAQFGLLARELPGARPWMGTRRFWTLLLGLNAGFLIALLAVGVLLGW